MHNAIYVREGTVTITGSHPHSWWSLCAQGHSILSQYQASLSLNKLGSAGGKEPQRHTAQDTRVNALRARGGKAAMTTVKGALIVVPSNVVKSPIETSLTSSGVLKVRTAMGMQDMARRGLAVLLGSLLGLAAHAAAASPW